MKDAMKKDQGELKVKVKVSVSQSSREVDTNEGIV